MKIDFRDALLCTLGQTSKYKIVGTYVSISIEEGWVSFVIVCVQLNLTSQL